MSDKREEMIRYLSEPDAAGRAPTMRGLAARVVDAQFAFEALKNAVMKCEGTFVVNGNDFYDWGWSAPETVEVLRRNERTFRKLLDNIIKHVCTCRNAHDDAETECPRTQIKEVLEVTKGE